MSTHCVALEDEQTILSGEQVEELKKITLSTPENRELYMRNKEIYHKGTLSECEAFISNQHPCLQEILHTEELIINSNN